MTKWFGAIALAISLAMGSAVTPSRSAAAAEATRAVHATDLNAPCNYRRYHVYGRHYAYRPYYPYYYGRPYYYSPGPFLPFIHGWEEPWLW